MPWWLVCAIHEQIRQIQQGDVGCLDVLKLAGGYPVGQGAVSFELPSVRIVDEKVDGSVWGGIRLYFVETFRTYIPVAMLRWAGRSGLGESGST
jgi:hypothetical protein